MRGLIVLAGMAVAALVAVLVWLDATGQLRPWLTTTPEIVFQLDPAPAATADSGATPAATIGTDAGTDAPADDAAIDPAGAGPGIEADAEAPNGSPAAIETATGADEGGATPAETELAADFGEGAVALSDVPIATGDATAASEATDGGDTATAGEPATATDEPTALSASEADTATGDTDDAGTGSDDSADTGDAPAEEPAAEEPAADDAAVEVAFETEETAAAEPADHARAAATQAAEATEPADAAATIDDAVPAPKPDAEAGDPAAVQTAALPAPPYDPNLPWRLYAAPFPDGEPRPRIAIVFVSLGLSDAATEAIIQQMPGAVTLAFSPYSRKLPDWIARARAKGHEVLVELPMEPLDYPNDDPGPLALLDDRPMEDNITRLGGILDRAEGAVGVAAQMGSRFTGDAALIGPILEALGERGFLYVDNGTAPMSVVPALSQRIAVPIVVNNHYLDTEASRIAIDGRLQQIERIARSEGAAVAFAMPYPISIERLLAWIPTLEAKGFVLAPATSVVGHQELP